jgi:hypothetical protein
LSVTKGMRLDTASTSTVFLPPTFKKEVLDQPTENAEMLLFGHNTSSTTYERKLDPMLLVALLMNQRCDIDGGSSTPPSIDSSPQVISHLSSTEDILTLMLIRSEVEQLVG